VSQWWIIQGLREHLVQHGGVLAHVERRQVKLKVSMRVQRARREQSSVGALLALRLAAMSAISSRNWRACS
jgi:hypothetical protein